MKRENNRKSAQLKRDVGTDISCSQRKLQAVVVGWVHSNSASRSSCRPTFSSAQVEAVTLLNVREYLRSVIEQYWNYLFFNVANLIDLNIKTYTNHWASAIC